MLLQFRPGERRDPSTATVTAPPDLRHRPGHGPSKHEPVNAGPGGHSGSGPAQVDSEPVQRRRGTVEPVSPIGLRIYIPQEES